MVAGLSILVAFVHWTMRRVARAESPLLAFGTFSDANYRAAIASTFIRKRRPT